MGLWDWVMDKLTSVGGGNAPASAELATTGVETAVAECAPEDTSTQPRWWEADHLVLTELQPIVRPNLSAEMLALENLIVSYFDGHDLNLPTMPRVPEQVLRELSSPNYSIRKVGAEISGDPVTSAAVLRLANSPLYRGMNKIAAVEPAIVRVGTGAIRALMLHQTLAVLTRAERKASQRLADILSLRAVASGATMRELAVLMRMDVDEAFMIGLLHDIGAVMVLRIINRQRPYVGRVDLDAFEYLAHMAHQEFGELLGSAWNLPDKFTHLLADHHRYPEPGDPLRHERLMLQLSDMIGGVLGFAPEAPYDVRNAQPALDLGLTDRGEYVDMLAALPDRVEDALQAFG